MLIEGTIVLDSATMVHEKWKMSVVNSKSSQINGENSASGKHEYNNALKTFMLLLENPITKILKKYSFHRVNIVYLKIFSTFYGTAYPHSALRVFDLKGKS